MEEKPEVDDLRLQVIDSDSSERFQRAMAEQNQRAHEFEHRLQSARLRHLLVDGATPGGQMIDLTSTVEPAAAVLPD